MVKLLLYELQVASIAHERRKEAGGKVSCMLSFLLTPLKLRHRHDLTESGWFSSKQIPKWHVQLKSEPVISGSM